MTELTLEQQITNFRERAKAFREEHGSVEALVGPDSPFATLGITSIDGVPIVSEPGIKFIDTSGRGEPDLELKGGLIYFHKDDHSTFGSKAAIDYDEDDPPEEWDWGPDDG